MRKFVTNFFFFGFMFTKLNKYGSKTRCKGSSAHYELNTDFSFGVQPYHMHSNSFCLSVHFLQIVIHSFIIQQAFQQRVVSNAQQLLLWEVRFGGSSDP